MIWDTTIQQSSTLRRQFNLLDEIVINKSLIDDYTITVNVPAYLTIIANTDDAITETLKDAKIRIIDTPIDFIYQK